MRTRLIALAAAIALLTLSVLSAAGAAPAPTRVIASDTAATADAKAFWGKVECVNSSRLAFLPQGGDGHRTASGTPQGNASYRRVTVLDGDDYYGERCELGENSTTGPTAFYHEGDRRVTWFSERLPSNTPVGVQHWQTVMQMKQAQTSHDAGTGPAIELEVHSGKWYVVDSWHTLWTFPAKNDFWTRFAWDVTYSKGATAGRLQVSVDLNGDGDFEDPGERSPTFHVATLATEVSGYAGDRIAAGSGIPSHLRLGIYHDPAIACPAPKGCSVDIDNVQVVG